MRRGKGATLKLFSARLGLRSSPGSQEPRPRLSRPGMGAAGRTLCIACLGLPRAPAAAAAPRGIPARPPGSPRRRPHLGTAGPAERPWGAAGPGARNATCPEPPPRRAAPFLRRPAAGKALPAGTEPGRSVPPMAVPGATASGLESAFAGSPHFPEGSTADTSG